MSRKNRRICEKFQIVCAENVPAKIRLIPFTPATLRENGNFGFPLFHFSGNYLCNILLSQNISLDSHPLVYYIDKYAN